MLNATYDPTNTRYAGTNIGADKNSAPGTDTYLTIRKSAVASSASGRFSITNIISPSIMPTTLQTSHNLLVATGPSPSVIRVKNIQSTIQGPSDAWGRPNRSQPITISVTVYLDKAFGSSSTTDALASDTIHYGLLSKAILATLTRLSAQKSSHAKLSLPAVLENIWIDLTGIDTSGVPVNDNKGTPLLQLSRVKSLQVVARLPKATLLGEGVSLSRTGVFEQSALMTRGMALKLHDIRVPILIGVNENERVAMQGVVANIEIERFGEIGDGYYDLERVVVKAMTNSSFETIEALVADLAKHLTAHLAKNHDAPLDGQGWHLNIGIEKPIAVAFADAPCVELRVGTNDVSLR